MASDDEDAPDVLYKITVAFTAYDPPKNNKTAPKKKAGPPMNKEFTEFDIGMEYTDFLEGVARLYYPKFTLKKGKVYSFSYHAVLAGKKTVAKSALTISSKSEYEKMLKNLQGDDLPLSEVSVYLDELVVKAVKGKDLVIEGFDGEQEEEGGKEEEEGADDNTRGGRLREAELSDYENALAKISAQIRKRWQAYENGPIVWTGDGSPFTVVPGALRTWAQAVLEKRPFVSIEQPPRITMFDVHKGRTPLNASPDNAMEMMKTYMMFTMTEAMRTRMPTPAAPQADGPASTSSAASPACVAPRFTRDELSLLDSPPMRPTDLDDFLSYIDEKGLELSFAQSEALRDKKLGPSALASDFITVEFITGLEFEVGEAAMVKKKAAEFNFKRKLEYHSDESASTKRARTEPQDPPGTNWRFDYIDGGEAYNWGPMPVRGMRKGRDDRMRWRDKKGDYVAIPEGYTSSPDLHFPTDFICPSNPREAYDDVL